MDVKRGIRLNELNNDDDKRDERDVRPWMSRKPTDTKSSHETTVLEQDLPLATKLIWKTKMRSVWFGRKSNL